MLHLFLPAYLSTASAAAPEGCPAPAAEADVARYARMVFQDFEARDSEAIGAHMEAALEGLGCLSRPISPQTAVLVHQARGLALRVEDGGNPDRARLAFAAARAIDADAALPESIAPGPEVAVYNDYYAIPLRPEITEALPRPRARSARLYLDSEPERQISEPWPSIVQYQAASGELRFSQYRMPGEPVRPYPEWHPYRAPLILAVASAAAAGAGIYGVSYSALAENYCLVSRPQGWEGCDRATYEEQYAWGERGWILIGVGGAGLLGSGAWAVANGRQVSVGLTRTW